MVDKAIALIVITITPQKLPALPVLAKIPQNQDFMLCYFLTNQTGLPK
jgi:hypothetical protein